MRTIEVDTDVFSKIWSFRASGEETEDQILRRVLVGSTMSASTSSAGVVKSADAKGQKIRWRDDVKAALAELGGKGSLAEIYAHVRSRRRAAGRSLPTSLEAVIRRELENNSSDSKSFTGVYDWFTSVDGIGHGIWALR